MPITVGRVTTKGVRTDTVDLFEKSGIMDCDTLAHMKFLAIIETDNGITATVVSKLSAVYELDPETILFVVWPGRLRSDFFATTAGEVMCKIEGKYK